MAFSITSESLIHVDAPFKVHAGPGAGKTYWLAKHINNVVNNSRRLGVTRKVACISYTNVGADTIYNRLHKCISCVEISTIHSFLYSYIVKPFLPLFSIEFGVNTSKMKVIPNEGFMTRGYIRPILENLGYAWIHPDSVITGLKKCRWEYSNGEFTNYRPRYPIPAYNTKGEKTKYFVSQKIYEAFLHHQWGEGYLSYDDIIYFAIKLTQRCPHIFNFLIAKFPYFFIDEFQDSIPPIIDLVKEMAHYGCIVGVVGDKAQTIYDFIGASPKLFDDFTVANIQEYEIHGNRRSSPQIIDLLNIIRPNFKQVAIEGISNSLPMLIIGEKLDAYEYALSVCKGCEIQSLAFPNIVANAMKYNINGTKSDEKLIDSDFDGDSHRSLYIKSLFKAVEYAYHNNLSDAWRYLKCIEDDRTVALDYLKKLLSGRSTYVNGSLFDFYEYVVTNLGIPLKRMKNGAAIKEFYLTHKYVELALGVAVGDSISPHKTIHKAKGDEFKNVLVIMDSKELDLFVNPMLEVKLSHRVYYVGLSRARERLFINVDNVPSRTLNQLEKLPIEIVNLRHIEE